MVEKSGSEALCYAIERIVGRMYGRIEYPRLAAKKSSLERHSTSNEMSLG